MKKILSNIRNKSPEFRFMLSIACAGILMAVIVGGYVAIEVSAPSTPQADAQSPIGSLVDSIKGTVAVSNVSSSQAQPQIIDASQTGENSADQNSQIEQPITPYDESNPFVDQSSDQGQDQNSAVAASTDQDQDATNSQVQTQ